MGNSVSIEECLKELNDDVLKNIREDYKKGNNINDIIQHHKTKNPEVLSKIYNLIKFENYERKRFLEEYCPYAEVRVFLRNFDKDKHPLVIQATDKGIINGVDDYLIRNNSKSLYLAKIRDFVYDETIQHTIKTELEKLKLGIEEISSYSNNVRKRYALFIYNDSLRKFVKKFKK